MLRQQLRIDQHAIALDAKQHVAHRNLDVGIDVRQLRIGVDGRVKRTMESQRDVGVLGGIFGGAFDRNLLERDSTHAFARHIVISDRLEIEMSLRQALGYTKARGAPPTPEAQRLINELRDFYAKV